MTKFIRTTQGWINVSTIARADVSDRSKKWHLYDTNGDYLGAASNYDFDPDNAGDPYVSSTGIVATCITVCHSEARPVPEDLFITRLHVIAWKLIGSGYAEPVLTESTDPGMFVLIECPDGRLLDAESQSFDNLDAAKEYILSRAQEKWDAEQAKKP